MKQALHIFLKDVRGLRIPIAVLMTLIACFTAFDVHRGTIARNTSGYGMMMLEAIVAAAVWFLIARSVHEDSLPDENEFWLTRPYERSSLLMAKLLMAVVVVGVPLFVADCVILATGSLSIAENLWGLVLRQLLFSAWLIVPPLAIASVTRSLTQSVLGWIVVIAVAALTYFPGALYAENDFRAGNERYGLSAALVLLVASVGLQYLRRGTIVGRAMIAAAILLPAPPFPESAALAIEHMNASPQSSQISLTADTKSVAEPTGGGYRGRTRCIPVPLTAGGVPAGWQVRVLSQNDRLEADGIVRNSGWHNVANYAGEFQQGGFIQICANESDVRELGGKTASLRTSIALGVFAPDKPVRVRATLDPFEVPGIGRCQFVQNFPKQYAMLCRAPVWAPAQGTVVVAKEDAYSSPINRSEYAWTPFRLLPGFSPVYKWVTMPIDEGHEPVKFGDEARFGLKILIRSGGEFEFRPVKQVAVLRREIAVGEVRFLAN